MWERENIDNREENEKICTNDGGYETLRQEEEMKKVMMMMFIASVVVMVEVVVLNVDNDYNN